MAKEMEYTELRKPDKYEQKLMELLSQENQEEIFEKLETIGALPIILEFKRTRKENERRIAQEKSRKEKAEKKNETYQPNEVKLISPYDIRFRVGESGSLAPFTKFEKVVEALEGSENLTYDILDPSVFSAKTRFALSRLAKGLEYLPTYEESLKALSYELLGRKSNMSNNNKIEMFSKLYDEGQDIGTLLTEMTENATKEQKPTALHLGLSATDYLSELERDFETTIEDVVPPKLIQIYVSNKLSKSVY